MPSPKEFAASLAESARRRKRHTWILGGAAVGTVLVAALMVWLFLFSSVFASKETLVEGNRLLGTEAVLETAAIPMDVPLARIDTGAIEARVEALPEVRSATADVDFPNTVRLVLDERAAVYQVGRGGGFDWVDRDGVVFRSGQTRSDQMPVAELNEDDERLRADVATVVESLPESLAGQAEEVQARSVDRIVVLLADDRQIVWGSADESALKAEVLEALVQVEAKVYDVSAPNHPTTR